MAQCQHGPRVQMLKLFSVFTYIWYDIFAPQSIVLPHKISGSIKWSFRSLSQEQYCLQFHIEAYVLYVACVFLYKNKTTTNQF